MPKKSVVLAISIEDNLVRLSLISKTTKTIGFVNSKLEVTYDEGVGVINPYEVLYYIRTGIQQLLEQYKVSIASIGFVSSPGYLFAWDKESNQPVTDCYLPYNGLKNYQFQEFKFSKFYGMCQDKLGINNDNDANLMLNLWLIAKQKKKFSKTVVVTGLEPWLMVLMTDGHNDALACSPSLMKELLFNDDWDEPLIKASGLNLNHVPKISNLSNLLTRNFMPLESNIPIQYSLSTDELIFDFLNGVTDHAIAYVHLSKINHIYFQNMVLDAKESHQSIRFSGTQSLHRLFGLSNGVGQIPISMDDIDHLKDAMAIAVDPFKSFNQQKFHLFNMVNVEPDCIRHIGILQLLFIIKYCISLFDQINQQGHIQHLAFSPSDWDPSVLQLCVDLCQVEGLTFSTPNWHDLLHVTYKSQQNDFFSSTKNDSVFNVKKRLIPLMDPLMSYSLYQPWETWFNKLYDVRC